MKEIKSKIVLDELTNQLYFEGLAEYTKHKNRNVAHYLDEISRPNLLINGDFKIWQRGEEIIINDNCFSYTADRHRVSLSNTGDFNKITHTENGLKLETTKVVSGANRYLCYHMENKDLEGLKGKEVTLSIKVRKLTKDSKVKLAVFGTFDLEEYKEIELQNTEFETLAFTYLFSSDILETSVLYTLDNASIEVGGGFEVAYIKLELGSFATSLIPKSYAAELAMCQRYYQSFSSFAFVMRPNSIGKDFIGCSLPCKMRIVPVVKNLSILNGTDTNVTDKVKIVAIIEDFFRYIIFSENINSDIIYASFGLDAEIY